MYHRWRGEREDQGNGERGDEPCDLNCNCGMNTVALTAPSVDEELQMYVCTHITYTSLCTCLEGSIHMHKFPNYIQWKDLVAITSPCMCVLVAQSCPALCNPMNYRPPGSSVYGISQARILERVAISSSRGSSQHRDQTCVSHIPCTGKRILYCRATRGAPHTVP